MEVSGSIAKGFKVWRRFEILWKVDHEEFK